MDWREPLILCILVPVAASVGETALAAEPAVVVEWSFDEARGWSGWRPNTGIVEVEFCKGQVTFQSTGWDPQIASPFFAAVPATNNQWVEIDVDCDGPGWGELFYTNKKTGRFGGLEPEWMNWVVIPAAGRQVVRIWPFWKSLGEIICLRFDPPGGVRCRLYSIRVVRAHGDPPAPNWTFAGPDDSWLPMYAARLERAGGQLRVEGDHQQAVIITPVEPFHAAKRSILHMEAECPDEPVLGLYWATEEEPSLYGVPITLREGRQCGDEPIDLRRFAQWRGTITHLAISLGTAGPGVLRLRSMSVDENDPNRPFLRVGYFGFERPINRPGVPARLHISLEHAGGPATEPGEATLSADSNARCAESGTSVPAIAPGERFVIRPEITPLTAGRTTLRLALNNQTFTASLRIDEPVELVQRHDYDVPPPRPVETQYNLGVYYFPGWSADQLDRWKKQADFPERDPVLGWYEEGRPEVADWHIKWAVENGVSFFIYDWYWRDGKEVLGAALNEGFLKARYGDHLKFAVMWANHKPFADHTVEQLLTVTDYWLDRYFHRANYLTIAGKPYVSFFKADELLSSLGTEDKVRKAFDAMRERVRAAGLPGLHIGVCAGPDPACLESLKTAGFDSVTGYVYLRTGTTTPQSPYRAQVLGHEAIWQAMRSADVLPYIPLLTVGWDSRPWQGPRARQRFARRTRDFAEGLTRLKAHLDAAGQKTAILEAWNEWGEGSCLEPNCEFGFKDLEAVRAAFAEPGDWPINIGPADLGLHGEYDLRQGR